MENSEYQTIVNYITRGEYPAGISKEQKRAIRCKVAERSGNATNSKKFVAVYCISLTRDPMDWGCEKGEWYGRRKKMQYFGIVTKLRFVEDAPNATRRTEKSRSGFIGTAS